VRIWYCSVSSLRYWSHSLGVVVLLCAEKDALDVQVHHLVERALGSLVEGRSPRRARIGEQDVDMVGVLANLGD
jgi:hypothetical protein